MIQCFCHIILYLPLLPQVVDIPDKPTLKLTTTTTTTYSQPILVGLEGDWDRGRSPSYRHKHH